MTRNEDAICNNGTEEPRPVSREDMKALFEEILATRELHLMKPVEQQALFLAGKLSQENKELRERMEIVVQENNILRDSFKALPLPPEELTEEFEKRTRAVTDMENINRDLCKKLAIEAECTRVARESEKQLGSQVREHRALISELEDRIKEIFLDEAHSRAELEAQWRYSMEELRAKLQEEEIAQAQLKAEWVRTIAALQDAQSPWWKRLFRKKKGE